MKTPIAIISILIALAGCDTDVEDVGRSLDVGRGCLEFGTAGAAPGFSVSPGPEGFFLCCKDGACGPPTNGFCPNGGILHECDDELICNEEGDACWHECEPVPPAPTSDSEFGSVAAPEPDQVNVSECAPGGCCSFVTAQGWFCQPVTGADACPFKHGYLACDPGTCMADVCDAGHAGSKFQENCCA